MVHRSTSYIHGDSPTFLQVIGIIVAVVIGLAIFVVVVLCLVVCCVLWCQQNDEPESNSASRENRSRGQAYVRKFHSLTVMTTYEILAVVNTKSAHRSPFSFNVHFSSNQMEGRVKNISLPVSIQICNGYAV